jgi:hypothetical protein
MLAFLTPFLSKAWAWILGAMACLATLGGALLAARSSGKAAQQAKDETATLKASQEATHVQNEVAATPAAVRRDRLRDWSAGG